MAAARINAHSRISTTVSTIAASPEIESPNDKSTNTASSDSEVLPPKHPYRTLVLCFDGTGDSFDQDNSNVVSFFSALKKGDPNEQMVYYQAGIGTYSSSSFWTPLATQLSSKFDEMFAGNIKNHIMDGYEFLIQNYRVGDRICLFGFSRGAYTARCLAGMVHKVGLLPPDNKQQVQFAYAIYSGKDNWSMANGFKKAFSIDVDVEFLGLWDCVGSVGIRPNSGPSFVPCNHFIRTFRHAVALDEHRGKFQPNLWNRPDTVEAHYGIYNWKKQLFKEPPGFDYMSWPPDHPYRRDLESPTDVKEVWFAGCHCDVGGGSVGNGVKPTLARIPLRWMIKECFRAYSGILFDTDELRLIGIDPDSLYPTMDPPPPLDLDLSSVPTSVLQIRPAKVPKAVEITAEALAGTDETIPTRNSAINVHPRRSEQLAELMDLLASIYDQLELQWFWKYLELIPLRRRVQNDQNKWETHIHWNLQAGREVPAPKEPGDEKIKIHRSVRTRLSASYPEGNGKYTPKAQIDLRDESWVNNNVEWVD